MRKSTTQKREHCLLEWGVDSDMSKHRRDMRGSEDIFKCSSTTYIFKTEWPYIVVGPISVVNPPSSFLTFGLNFRPATFFG